MMGIFDWLGDKGKDGRAASGSVSGGFAAKPEASRHRGVDDVNPVRWEDSLRSTLLSEHGEILGLCDRVLDFCGKEQCESALESANELSAELERHSSREETKLYKYLAFEGKFDPDVKSALAEAAAFHAEGAATMHAFVKAWRMTREVKGDTLFHLTADTEKLRKTFAKRASIEEATVIAVYPTQDPASKA